MVASRRLTGLLALPVIVVAFTVCAQVPERKPAPPPPGKDAPKTAAEPGMFEARFNDGSALKLTLRDSLVELTTPYGKLVIPANDIHRIEFGWRAAPEVLSKVELAVMRLGSPAFKEREAAGAELFGLKEKSYPALVQAARHTDPEVARRAEDLLARLREVVAEDVLEAPPHDIVYTKDSKFTGQIAVTALKVQTTQFGELHMKLTDVRGLRSMAAPAEEVATKDVQPDPGSLSNFAQQVGKTLRFRVTGNVQGSLWGTGFYTTDSTLAMAAVHAGVLKQGQTGIVTVVMLPAQPAFAGTTANGVTSSDYGMYPAAFQILKRRGG
jgi:hypothetical protein